VIERQKEKLVKTKGGYVRSAQVYSTFVVTLHILAMMILLLQVGFETIQGSKKPSKPNVYYMGFLNAILFSHRSGFKLRFIYSSRLTSACVLLFIFFSSHNLHWDPYPWLWLEYTCYVIVVQVMGILISHEEESLRRSFFVLKAMRILEFEQFFKGVVVIQKGARKFLQRRDAQQRMAIPSSLPPKSDSTAVVHAQSFLAMASKLGCQAQMIQIAVVLFDVLYTAITK
jgi:hypothetical protein